jgi:hypothetical protein
VAERVIQKIADEIKDEVIMNLFPNSSWCLWTVLAITAIVFVYILSTDENRSINQAIQLIKSHFHFLFDRDFEIINKKYDNKAFGNWLVVLKSKECVVRFIKDRTNIDVEIGPSWASTELSPKGHFVGLQNLIAYIENKPVSLYRTDDRYLDVNAQMQRLAALFSSHYNELISFVNRDDFSEQKEKISAHFWNELKKRYPNIQ